MFEDKKITLTTIKSLIKKNKENLYIKNESDFCGMNDCVMSCDDSSFHKVQEDERIHCEENTLGISGAWFVKGSRDYFKSYEDGEFTGVEVYNCCGSFVLAIKK